LSASQQHQSSIERDVCATGCCRPSDLT
jgi:hypothetical protein